MIKDGVRKMLSIYFGEKDNVLYGPGWFKNNYELSWFEDDLVQEMIVDVDKSEYRGGELIYSSVIGPIPPERLSGGVKTLISIYMRSDVVFDATSCGENCSKWLLEIGKRKDVLINLRYPMRFRDSDKLDVYVQNVNMHITDKDKYMMTALQVLHEERVK